MSDRRRKFQEIVEREMRNGKWTIEQVEELLHLFDEMEQAVKQGNAQEAVYETIDSMIDLVSAGLREEH